MPNYLKYLVCVLLAGVACSASGQSRLPSFDTGFKTMRENVVGADFHYSVDDYLQYSPAAVLLGLKVAGYESRTSWGRMAVSDAFSVAVMAAAVNGIKYSVARMRPDGSSRNSFPSGHTATAFMLAAMLHEEYGWRSPWFSFGGYAVASFTGVSRILNNRHWTSDIVAGAVIGMASVKLGYFLADLIFKDRYISDRYNAPVFGFDPERKYYDIGMWFGYRFFLGDNFTEGSGARIAGGSSSGIEVSVPLSNAAFLKGTAGLAFRAGINSYIAPGSLSFNTYDFMAGGYWRRPFARVLEADARILAGYSLPGNRSVSGPAGILDGIGISAGCGLSVTTGENFKIKAFAAYEAARFTVQKPMSQSLVLGGSALFFW